MTITAQLDDAAELPISLAAQFLGLAFPGVPGFKGQGWSSQETAMAVRWLLGNPAAWDRAMATARQYPGNPHTVADTLHEHIVPRSELEAIAAAGGDPAKVNWLEIAHELIERRNDPMPAQEHAGIAAQALDLAADAEPIDPTALPVPDDPAAIAMYTAHRTDDAGKHLAHASERLDAAREASGDLRAYHMAHCSHHLDDAHTSAHQLAANLRAHYPAEGAELDALTGVVGLAVAVSQDAKTATTAHLVQTTCNHLAHTLRHVTAMGEDPDPDVWGFNAEHARTHLDGALEHVGKLTGHLRDNYPAEAGFLAGLGSAVRDAKPEGGAGKPQPAGTVSAQLANRGYELNPRSGMISLDLPPGIITPIPGGVSDFHITVVYLGPDVDDEAFAQACERAKAAAAAMPGPLTGMVGGIGTFPPSDGSDGKVPVWAGVVLPGADQLRQSLEDLSASEHKNWAPHVTVTYADPGDPLPAPLPAMQVQFGHLSVHRGDDEVMRYPLGASASPDCCGAQCCAGGCCNGAGGCRCGPATISGQAARPVVA